MMELRSAIVAFFNGELRVDIHLISSYHINCLKALYASFLVLGHLSCSTLLFYRSVMTVIFSLKDRMQKRWGIIAL